METAQIFRAVFFVFNISSLIHFSLFNQVYIFAEKFCFNIYTFDLQLVNVHTAGIVICSPFCLVKTG
ncbi:MAG: hypothetical protein D8M61_08485 [Ignavibacteriae bacterium]|nr:hypothetical protein [Ignavibacteriota bacterium]